MTQPHLSIRQVDKGQTIFRQGGQAEHMYIIKDGKVDIHLSRDDKTIHLSTLERGAFFGEMALISGSPRSATATALESTELYVIDSRSVQALLDRSDPFVRHMLRTMVAMIRAQNVGTARSGSETPKLLGYAHLIEMVAREAAPGTSRSPANDGLFDSGAPVVIATSRIGAQAGVFFGDSRAVCQATLRYMARLGLLTLETTGVRTQFDTLVERASRLPLSALRGLDAVVASEQDLMELAEVEHLMKSDRQDLLKTLEQFRGRDSASAPR